MPTIRIDNKVVEFPPECYSNNKETAYREQLIVAAAALFPKADMLGRTRYDLIVRQMQDQHGITETKDSVRSVLTRVRRRVRQWQERQQYAKQHIAQQIVEEPSLADDATARFMEWIGLTPVNTYRVDDDNERKIVIVIADIHGYPHEFLLNALATIAAQNTENLPVEIILGGDLYDIFCSSGVGRIDGVAMGAAEFGEKRFRQESANIGGFIKGIFMIIPNAIVKLVRGNHDEIRKLFAKSPFWAFKEFVRDPLEMIADAFPNVELVNWNVPYLEPDGTYHDDYKHVPYAYIAGDLFVSHLNKTGGQPFKSVNDTWNWIQGKRFQHNLHGIRVVAQAHSHKLSSQDRQGGHVRLLEIGFGGNVKVLRYQIGYNVWNSEVSSGFLYLEQEREYNGSWKTDLNSIRHVRP